MKFEISNLTYASPATPKTNDTRTHFKGINAGKIKHLISIKNLSSCHLDDIYNNLSEKIAPDFIHSSGGDILYKKANSFVDTLKFPFIDMPKEFLSFIAKKLNIESLKKSKFLTEFQDEKIKKNYERAMRGLLQNGDSIIEKVALDNNINLEDLEKFLCENKCNPKFKEICTKAAEEFYKIFDENLSKTKAHYNTPHERTVARLASGITAAIIMGNDFYNKSILNGKSDKEAKESEKKKRKQELLETIQEAISQYFMLGAFAGIVNNSPIAAPIINTLLGLLFKITSRLSTGRPLKRIKIPKQLQYNMPEFYEYEKAAKEKKNIKINAKTKTQEKKNHVLSPKNIVIACFISIFAGFAGSGIKNTKEFEKLKGFINDTSLAKGLKKKYYNLTTGEVWLSKEEIEEFIKKQKVSGLRKTSQYFDKLLNEAFSSKGIVKDGKLFIGQYEKMTHIPFTKIQMSKKELLEIPLAPFKLVFELASYPYRLARGVLEAGGIVKKVKKDSKLKNDYHILNTYLDYKEKLKAHGGIIDSEFIEKYSNHLKNNRISALNKETQSSVNNSAIGKTSQIMGTFASLYFAMADDYNETAKQTGDKQKAQKDARLRGVNKIIRMSTQTICMQLNHIFKISYAKSILGAGVITAVCTVLTDTISRTLSGMPFRKMNKEELVAYNKHKKESVLKGYYSAIDKLTD